MKKMNHYWTISIEDAELQWHLFALQSKGDCYLSANTKIVGIDKAVQVTSKELAVAFCNAVMPTLRRRHGVAVLATVCALQTTDLADDDELVASRIAENMFAPNKRPTGALMKTKNQI